MKRTACIALIACVIGLSAPAFGQDASLIGAMDGLYRIQGSVRTKVWDHGDIRKIMRVGLSWYFLTETGIFTSQNLMDFEGRNEGLPIKVIKVPQEGGKRFENEVQGLKDLEVHPDNPLIMVTATKDAVFLTADGGASWKNQGISAATAGVKAVSVFSAPDSTGAERLVILMSHPIYGVSWKYADPGKASPGQTGWADIVNGLEKLPSISWPDEIADILAVKVNGKLEIWASNTFMPRLYSLDWPKKTFATAWKGEAGIGTVEGLARTASSIVFTSPREIAELRLDNPAKAQPGADLTFILKAPGAVPQCAYLPASRTNGRGDLSLTELWLLEPEKRASPYAALANLRKGNYLQVHQVTSPQGLSGHLQTLKNNNLNMLVIDMKDDYGYLRYDAKDPLVLSLGNMGKGIVLEDFVKTAKENGIYLVARIVVFKDRELSRKLGGKYAVWDMTEKKAWQGYDLVTQKLETAAGEEPKTETVKKYIEEFWVDPYSEEVWAYNTAIAKELVSRGFDEIQFDYIRFPTDGRNLSDAAFRWQDAGMDKESALMSFLSYARSEIKAPISIDIYGANGWYRTGARTGQDVELLARYVDAICPMFYPSHFEQGFLAHAPAEERPYRIYFFGSYRNSIIARNHVIVRPWAQAFYLNVSFDRTHYNADYVQRQVFGARDSVNQGYTYWNNSGRYADLRPDPSLALPYPWTPVEGASSLSIPFFGGKQ